MYVYSAFLSGAQEIIYEWLKEKKLQSVNKQDGTSSLQIMIFDINNQGF